jgi:hypothetical protein
VEGLTKSIKQSRVCQSQNSDLNVMLTTMPRTSIFKKNFLNAKRTKKRLTELKSPTTEKPNANDLTLALSKSYIVQL